MIHEGNGKWVCRTGGGGGGGRRRHTVFKSIALKGSTLFSVSGSRAGCHECSHHRTHSHRRVGLGLNIKLARCSRPFFLRHPLCLTSDMNIFHISVRDYSSYLVHHGITAHAYDNLNEPVKTPHLREGKVEGASELL